MLERIYLDHSATTPVDPRVFEEMLPSFKDMFGNPSSIHIFGQQARALVDKARQRVASLINARPNEIIFTSGGTESNNLAIRGLLDSFVRSSGSKPNELNIVTSAIEHPSVKNLCEDLEKRGVDIKLLPVYDDGMVRIKDIEEAVDENTFLISVMSVNNEIGTIQPIAEIGRFVRLLRGNGRKIWFHTDAVQAAGKMKVDVEEIGCDLLTISGHKIYAPKGIGTLYLRRGTRLHPQNIGGRQERGMRGGTESVPLIVGFGKAAELANEFIDAESSKLRVLRDEFETGVLENINGAVINGARDSRVSSISNISFPGIEGEALLINLDMQGVAVSTGSACSSGTLEPSPVIRALGHGDDMARSAIRFSFGRYNTAEEAERVLRILPEAIGKLRALTPTAKAGSGH